MNSQGQTVDSTQPISQSFYDSIIKKGKSVALLSDQDETLETQRTLREGEHGHVDIMSSFVTGQEESRALQNSSPESDAEPAGFSPTQTQRRLTQFAESQRFKTPVTAGRKRNYNGDFTDTPARPRNPLLRNGEPTPGKLMGLSQVFAGTQALSSPLSNGLPTGPRSDRPSPSIELYARRAPAADTSPLRPISDHKRAITQPAIRYVPLKQSQAERELHAQHTLSDGVEREESHEDEFEDDPSYLLRLRKMQDREERVNAELRRLSSPIQPDPDMMEEDPETCSSKSPDLQESEHETADITSDMMNTHQQSEDETDRDDEHHDGGPRTLSIAEEDKENHLVKVPRTVTSSRLHNAINAGLLQSQSSPSSRYTVEVQLNGFIHSSGPNNIPNSQPGEDVSRAIHPDTNSTILRRKVETGVATGLQARDEPRRYAIDGQSLSDPHNSQVAVPDVNPASSSRSAIGHGKPSQSNEAKETVPETESDLRGGGDQPTYASSESVDNDISKAQSGVLRANNINENQDNVTPDLSSQPIVTTPPGRRRRRLLDISAEPSPLKSTPSFDADQALELDPDQEAANFLAFSPLRKVTYSNKRRRISAFSTDGIEIQSPVSSAMAPPARADHKAPHTVVREPGMNLVTDTGVSITPKATTDPTAAISSAIPVSTSRRSVWDLENSPVKPAKIRKRHTTSSTALDKSSILPATTSAIANDTVSPPAGRATPDSFQHTGEIEARLATEKRNAPNMVFACFNGKVRAYYPARCLGFAAGNPKKYRIQWEGYEPDEVDAWGVKALDIRQGDIVKVNLNQFSKMPHVVQGFKDRVDTGSECVTDVYGYRTLVVVPKQSKSLSSDIKPQVSRDVPVASIYLDNNMWSRMKDRDFAFTAMDVSTCSGHATPVDRAGTPNTPSSRSRRQLGMPVGASMSFGQDGIFAYMAFAISYEDPTHKNRLATLIQSHGGLILNDSFHDLLQPDEVHLKDQFRELGFTALITERHSRKEKYIQALALGLPCLSGSWIEDCVDEQALLDWHTYLLAAGECAKLDGAIRSRTLPAFDPKQVKLRDMLAARPPLLDSKAIVVIGRGKTELKRAPYVWLVRVMGALQVDTMADVKGVGELVAVDDSYRWVFVEDRDTKSTRDVIQAAKSQPNKSSRKAKGTDRADMSECAVAGNEAIIQTLILGQIWNK